MPVRPFDQARAYVRSLALPDPGAYRSWTRGLIKNFPEWPADIPRDPKKIYGGEWVSWEDWLGSEHTARRQLRYTHLGNVFAQQRRRFAPLVAAELSEDGSSVRIRVRNSKGEISLHIARELHAALSQVLPGRHQKKQEGHERTTRIEKPQPVKSMRADGFDPEIAERLGDQVSNIAAAAGKTVPELLLDINRT